jgi:hypothetical protein
MISKTFWEGAFKYGDADKVLEAIIYPVILCALFFILPKCMADFAIVMSLPPFFSHKNERVLHLVLVQVVDQEMVRARAAVKKRLAEAGTGKDVKARLKSIYHGTAMKNRFTTEITVSGEDGKNGEEDDTMMQPFIDHNQVMQAQQTPKDKEQKSGAPKKKGKAAPVKKSSDRETTNKKALIAEPDVSRDPSRASDLLEDNTVIGKTVEASAS